MRRLWMLLIVLATGCSAAPDPADAERSNQGYTVIESCSTTTDCGNDGGVTNTIYSFDTSNESNGYPDGGASFPTPNGGCSQTTSCTPSCKNTGDGDVCGGAQPPGNGGCWVTGGGYIVDADGHDSFGGNAMPMKSGAVRGQWEEQDHGPGDKAHGTVSYIVCRTVPGPGPGHPNGPSHKFDVNQAYFGGPARWFASSGWQDGFWFDVMVEDHGEPGRQDVYHFTIRQLNGPVVYDTIGELVGGNIQIHPPNNGHPYNGGTLPSWVSVQP